MPKDSAYLKFKLKQYSRYSLQKEYKILIEHLQNFNYFLEKKHETNMSCSALLD